MGVNRRTVRSHDETERDVDISATERRADVVIVHIAMLDGSWSSSHDFRRAIRPEPSRRSGMRTRRLRKLPALRRKRKLDQQPGRCAWYPAGVWIVGDGSCLPGGRVLIVVAALSAWPPEPADPRSGCDLAFHARAWDRVAAECRDPRWAGRAELATAWTAWEQHRDDEALGIAEQLLDSRVAADASYLAGYIRGHRDGAAEQDLSRVRFQQALHGYQRAGRHADASRAASFLSRVPRPDRRFDDELRMAQLAVTEADLSGDRSVLGRAVGALAESYDWIGMERAARESFVRAEQLTEPWPAELAHIYFKHAEFLLDLGTPQDLETSLRYLDAATAMRSRVLASDLAGPVAQLGFAIRLNRADALSQLGRLEAADRELADAEHELGADLATNQLATVCLVKGYVAARRHNPATAEALFIQADDGSLDGDFRWRIALELARSYRGAGRADRAEAAYRSAIAIIEQLRSAAAVVELRPWVLARRTLPYVELLALLVEQDRGVDALVIAESLHARAWLDVVLGPGAGHSTTPELALAAARIRQRLSAASVPALDGSSLTAATGDREALVFLSIGAETWRAHITSGAVHFRRLPADTLDAAQAFEAAPGDPAAAERASAILLPAELSTSGGPLYVVASGRLADVPFAALRLRGRYVIEDRPIARLPGLAALRCSDSTWDQRAIFLGDSRGDLPEAAREVQQIAAAMGVPARVGQAASRQALTRVHGAGILHIAAHSIATASGRAIVLADGNVTAADVLDAGLDPRIVVLSGCATAASDDAESWDGFPSAFLAAGSRYVVATLRSVDDAAAARVTTAYYAQPTAMNPIERLAAAQRQVSAVLPVAAWASFAAWGSPDCDVSKLQ